MSEVRDLAHELHEEPENDLGNGRRFVARYGEQWRWTDHLGSFCWTGKRWESDELQAVRFAKATALAIFQEIQFFESKSAQKSRFDHALSSGGATRLREMIWAARSEPGMSLKSHALDADPFLLNCLSGTLNLKTDELQPHRREDYITKMCPVEYRPDATAPRFQRFIERILPDEGIRAFVKRALGYSLTGSTGEEALFVPFGSGRNGKSKLLGVVEEILGDYAKTARPQTFLAKQNETIPNDVAALVGARFVPSYEIEEGKRLDVALVKQLTGSDIITARFFRKEWFEFRPQFKIWFAVNHKPVIRDTTDSIWDRVHLIPFPVYIPPEEREKDLSAKLWAEAPGILRWLVEGCQEWQEQGLNPPAAVRAATESYRQEMDVLGGFIRDCCVVMDIAQCGATDLYQAYRKWTDENGEYTITQTAFGTRLADRGFQRKRATGGAKVWLGIGLVSVHHSGEVVNGSNGHSALPDDDSGLQPFTGVNSCETEFVPRNGRVNSSDPNSGMNEPSAHDEAVTPENRSLLFNCSLPADEVDSEPDVDDTTLAEFFPQLRKPGDEHTRPWEVGA